MQLTYLYIQVLYAGVFFSSLCRLPKRADPVPSYSVGCCRWVVTSQVNAKKWYSKRKYKDVYVRKEMRGERHWVWYMVLLRLPTSLAALDLILIREGLSVGFSLSPLNWKASLQTQRSESWSTLIRTKLPLSKFSSVIRALHRMHILMHTFYLRCSRISINFNRLNQCHQKKWL